MIHIAYQQLSPIHTDVFPCIGTHTTFHYINNKPIPDKIVLRVGINPNNPLHTKSMLIKLSNNQEHNSQKDILITKLKTQYPVTVRFSNLCCYVFDFNGNTGYTGYAADFEILED